jgi:hypothetical protein
MPKLLVYAYNVPAIKRVCKNARTVCRLLPISRETPEMHRHIVFDTSGTLTEGLALQRELRNAGALSFTNI